MHMRRSPTGSLSKGTCALSLACRGSFRESSECSRRYPVSLIHDANGSQLRRSRSPATRRDDRVAVLRIVLPERSWYDGRACRHGRAQNLRWLEPTRTTFQLSLALFHPNRVHSGLPPEI